MKAPGNEPANKACGFTLIEVMVAMAILSGVIAALVVSFNYNMRAADLAREDILMAALGKQKLEDLKVEGVADREGDFGEDYPGLSWALLEEDSGLKEVKRLELKVIRKKGPPFSIVSYVQKK